MCSESDDSYLRPPLWEDITSSIQNIDPENAIMLSNVSGATQVKMEAVDDAFLEPLSSPLLSPLEIKTEKVQNSHLQSPPHNNNNNILHHNNHLNNNNNNTYLPPGINNNNYHSNGGGYGNGPPNGMHHNSLVIQNNNYYSPGWQNTPHPQHNHQHNSYPPKFSPQGNLCPPMSRLMYVPPLTPPNSDPGSPINGIQVRIFSTNLIMNSNASLLQSSNRVRTPPPPYHPSQQLQQHPQQHQITQVSHNQLTCTPLSLHNNSQIPSHHHHLSSNHQTTNYINTNNQNSNSVSVNGGSPVTNPNNNNHHHHNHHQHPTIVLSSAVVSKAVHKYNRRNNPELEKRRIHHCDFMGE